MSGGEPSSIKRNVSCAAASLHTYVSDYLVSAQQSKKHAGTCSEVLFGLLKCKVFYAARLKNLAYPKSLIWDKQTLIK